MLLGDKGAFPEGFQDWQDHPAMEADFLWPAGACLSFFGLQDSYRGLAVLGSCSTGVQHLLRAGEASPVARRHRSSSPGQLGLAGLPCKGSRFHAAGQSLF